MVWATSCPLLGGGGWERWGWRVGGGLQADQPRSWSQGPWSSNQRPWGLDPDEGHWGTKLGSGEGRGPSKQPVRGGLHVPERGRVKGLSRNLISLLPFSAPSSGRGGESGGVGARQQSGRKGSVPVLITLPGTRLCLKEGREKNSPHPGPPGRKPESQPCLTCFAT